MYVCNVCMYVWYGNGMEWNGMYVCMYAIECQIYTWTRCQKVCQNICEIRC